jgi:hypothetical protein
VDEGGSPRFMVNLLSMTVRSRVLGLLMTLAFIASVLASPASAHSSQQKAVLSGAEVVPQEGDPDGRAKAHFKTASEIEVVCYEINFKAIGKPSAGHIHQGSQGATGPVTVDLFGKDGDPREGCVFGVDEATIEAMQYNPNGYYVDLHNAEYPDGALRGQLETAAAGSTTLDGCKDYKPPKQGRGEDTIYVDGSATPLDPLEIPVTVPAASPIDPVSIYRNLQVATTLPSSDLFIRYVFTASDEHDLFVMDSKGRVKAAADGVNATSAGPLSTDNDSGGHSELGAEQIDGLKTSRCAGYTLELRALLTGGGDMMLQLWVQ